MAVIDLPKLPVAHDELVNYIANHPKLPMSELMEPYRKFETKLREMYAQERNNPILDNPTINVLPLFTKDTPKIRTRARNLEAESPEEKERYIMPLPADKRRANGSPAVVTGLKEFRRNFNIFSESSLAELDWSNVVAAGSSVVNCIAPVPDKYNKTKRGLRQYFHKEFCPASDVDLFLYGLNEEQAIQKIKDIETQVRDAILTEVTVVRTKNAITLCSKYPTRHIQIVLRVYKTVSEILTGFDIDCSGAAYDGDQVYCTPRALASYITQINPVDLSRRSPSYENRLSKYNHRNFEVYWKELDRSRIDPTIFERSFMRVLGLARLLVLERLPTTNAREQYMKKRRAERGRPALENTHYHRLRGNLKEIHEDEVPDWVDENEVSNYHTFSVPYGERFYAKKIEKLCYTKDLLLNAEWNQPKDREVYLHRHPAFFGRVEDVIGDCCGTCPTPQTPEEIEIAEKESEIYVSGKVSFRIDDPGRQQIGSFNPLTEDDWTEMAYVGNTARLCQAIVDCDLEHVEDWLLQEGADPNKRDYTGRTPLHLAVMTSTPQIVKCLVDHGARLTPRLADGRTALHLAAARGDIEVARTLLEKSNANEEEEENRQDQLRMNRRAAHATDRPSPVGKEPDAEPDDEASEAELISDAESDGNEDARSATTGSFVKVNKDHTAGKCTAAVLEDDQSEPDFYKIDAIAWDSRCSPLHFAIIGGHCEVVRLLCQDYGADVLLPIVKVGDGVGTNSSAVLSLVLALSLPVEKAIRMLETLLSLGATSSQAEPNSVTAFHRYIQSGKLELIESLMEKDKIGVNAAINHAVVLGHYRTRTIDTPLLTALVGDNSTLVSRLLDAGANAELDYDTWLKDANDQLSVHEKSRDVFKEYAEQPLIVAIKSRNPSAAIELLERGADPNTLTASSHIQIRDRSGYFWRDRTQAALDLVRHLLRKYREYGGKLAEANQHHDAGKCPGFFDIRYGTYRRRPQVPAGIAQPLEQFSEGTYQHWVALLDAVRKISNSRREIEQYEKYFRENSELGGLREKLNIDSIISQLEAVEDALEAKNAKTFQEQYPDMKPYEEPVQPQPLEQLPKPYSLEFNLYDAPDAVGVRRDAYIKLFEAAWAGDLSVIKSLTLASWDPAGKEPPLRIAVRDELQNNPFSLAFIRGHYEVAEAILEIVRAQWAPPESDKTVRFTMNEGEDGYSSDSDDDDQPRVYRKIIDTRFTIENVGQVSMQVQGFNTPSVVLGWHAQSFSGRANPDRFPSPFPRQETLLRWGQLFSGQDNLLWAAMVENDAKAFDFLLDLNIRFSRMEPADEDGSSRFYTFPQNLFEEALKLGRTEMLASAIKRTGAGVPVEHLVKKSGTALQIKPRYYQGLNVYGKKRSDWANAGRNLVVKASGSKIPPLLTAAAFGSLESTEWIISGAPMRLYIEFGGSKVAEEDPRYKHLKEAPGGFDRAISKWLGVQNDLVIHCAVMADDTEVTNKLIEYLIKVCPSSFEARTSDGWTPLYLACLLGRVEFAKTLIKAGADQSVKDKKSNNIIHASLTNNPKPKQLRDLLDLLDTDLRSHLFLQRNGLTHGGDTPLHLWLKAVNRIRYTRDIDDKLLIINDEDTQNIEMLRLILEFSGGAELDILNGSGDTVLHTAVLRYLPGHAQVLLAQDPTLLYRENAIGRTPSEVAYDLFVNSKINSQPTAESYRHLQIVPPRQDSWRPDNPFADDSSQGSAKNRVESTWRVMEEYLAKVNGKRRLASLSEATDVAKRLTEEAPERINISNGADFNEAGPEETQEPQEGEEERDYVSIQYLHKSFSAWAEHKKDSIDDKGHVSFSSAPEALLELLGM